MQWEEAMKGIMQWEEAMKGIESSGNRKNRGSYWKILCLGILVLGILGFSVGSFAQVKGVYYDGYGFMCRNVQGRGEDLRLEARAWESGEWNYEWGEEWLLSDYATGSMGACVFNDILYCFFTTTGGKLQYVTLDPASHHQTGPTTVASGISAHGTAAAVCKGEIHVITVNYVFVSTDGRSYKKCSFPSGNGLAATRIFDAVTFYPPNGGSPGIMVLYNGMGSPADLEASRFYPPEYEWYGGETLPWPPANPYPWAPITQGNLALGTSIGYGGGAKEPCVQFYGMTAKGADGQHGGRWEYRVRDSSWHFYDMMLRNEIYELGVAPWFDTRDSTTGLMQLCHTVAIQYLDTEEWHANHSDYMVPQHSDNGWMGKETVTSTATSDTDKDKKLRALWSLVGVVLGPPPFAKNGAEDASDPILLSSVDYGTSVEHSVTTTQTSTQTLSVAMDNSISDGFGKFKLDLSYAHAWTHSHGTTHTVEVSTNYKFSPEAEDPPVQGTHGWAIFSAPTFRTQQYKLYAYDYDQSSGSGTYLGQDIYATSIGPVVSQIAYYKLQDPSDGTIPGLLEGMPVYPDSTDIQHWYHIRDWNDGGSNWSAIFGDQSNPAVGTLSVGAEITQEYSQIDSAQDTHGNTNSFSVEAGASFDVFEGFESGVTVGYDAEFETESEVETTITKDVSCTLNMPIPPDTPGYVKSMTTQPYWLRAKTNMAPWIPSGYNGNLPWCITWDVYSYSKVNGETVGVAPASLSTSGSVSNGRQKKDRFSVDSGTLAWLDEFGVETPLSMTADDFDPPKGAAVRLNGYTFPADGSKGKWTQQGDQWKYKTREWVKKDPFVLKLDFADKTWSFDGESKHLDQNIKTADGAVLVELDLQGTHRFTNWLKHDVDATWYHKENKADWTPVGVHKFKGAYNSSTGVGHVIMKGHFPKDETDFGDMEISINGVSVEIPLLALPHFLDDMESGATVTYQEGGLSFKVDFGEGRWNATIEGNAFQAGMAPKGGTAEIQILIGGTVVSDQTLVIKKYLSKLSYGG
jgi:hypothetical protein